MDNAKFVISDLYRIVKTSHLSRMSLGEKMTVLLFMPK
jgi:hypothetical protein